MSQISQDAAEKILGSISIPPRPSILTELMDERKKSDPDMAKIARIISKDVVLSAAMLKTVNSPFFALRRKIDSIEQAVMTMGSSNVFNIMTGLVLRNLNENKNPQLNQFWESAENTAFIAAMLAKRIPGVSSDVAYTVGLFHDCAIPLMMSRFPDYQETINLSRAKNARSFTKIEDERHSTNHAVIGYLLARNWNLSETIALTILHHHNLDVFTSDEDLPAEVYNLIAVIQIAESISDSGFMRENTIWKSNARMLLDYVGMSEQELGELTDEFLQQHAT